MSVLDSLSSHSTKLFSTDIVSTYYVTADKLTESQKPSLSA